MNVRDAVTTTARDLGYGSYHRQIDEIATRLESGYPDGNAVDLIVGYGAPRSIAEQAVARVRSLVEDHAEPMGHPVATAESFDRERAAAVIRAFIQQGADRNVGHDALYETSDVDALLILAGLEDEPEPEVEDVADVEPGVIRRLLSWARGQGFNG